MERDYTTPRVAHGTKPRVAHGTQTYDVCDVICQMIPNSRYLAMIDDSLTDTRSMQAH